MDTVINKQPRATIIMPVYNGARYIRQAIDSLLVQTYKEFEILIINDGSTDNSVEIINSYKDSRIKLLHNPKNMGLVATRNLGVQEAKTELVGFLDCDDIATPDRLQRQVEFLDAHPDVVLVGGGAVHIDSDSNKTGTVWKEVIPSKEIPIELLFRNCFIQSTVLMRKEKLPEVPYKAGFAPAEDYELWVRLARIGRVVNLPGIFARYRVHSTNTSLVKSIDQERARRQIICDQFKEFGIFPTNEEYLIHKTNFISLSHDPLDFLRKREDWLERLLDANKDKNIFDQVAFAKVVGNRLFDSCRTNTRAGWDAWKIFWRSPLHSNFSYSDERALLKILKFAIGSFLKTR
jgi:glycosyltransferase involved in cell wall biosynthesis